MMHPNIRLFYWFNLFKGLRLAWPFQVIYFAQITGSYTLAMSIISVVYVSQVALELPTGYLSDRFSRKSILVLAAFFGVIASILYALGGSYEVLLMGAVVEGLALALASGNNNALLYDSLKENQQSDNYHVYFGKVSSLFQLGAAIAAVLGGLIAEHSLQILMLTNIIPYGVCLALAFWFVEPRTPPNEEPRHLLQDIKEAYQAFKANPKLRLMTFISAFSHGHVEAIFEFQSLMFKQIVPFWVIGAARTLDHLTSMVSCWFAGPVLNRFGYKQTLMGGTLFYVVIQMLAALSNNILTPFLMAITGIVFGTNDTAKNALLNREFSDKQRATMGSITSLGGSLFFAVFTIALGLLADLTNPYIAFFSGIALGAILLPYLYTRYFRL